MADLARVPRSLLSLDLPHKRLTEHDPAREESPRSHRRLELAMLLPLCLFCIILLAGFVFPLPSATEQFLTNRLAPPPWLGGSWEHPLGTDGLGRDVLARITRGSWVSLQISVVAATLAAVIGIAFGVISGVFGGWTERVLTLLAEVTLTIPSVVVGVVLTATLGQSYQNLIVILVLGGWISYARLLRLETRQLIRSDFVLAAAAIGGSRAHVSRRHILPNLMPTMIVLFCQQLGGMMLWEASLTYLGLGARPDTITLGGIVREGQAQIFNGWWISVASGFTVALAIVGFAFAGDWLRNRLDRGGGSVLQ